MFSNLQQSMLERNLNSHLFIKNQKSKNTFGYKNNNQESFLQSRIKTEMLKQSFYHY